MKQLIKRLFYGLTGRPERASGKAYLEWMRKRGFQVGEGTIVFDPQHIEVDDTRPELIKIGKNVLLHKGTTIISHDYASRAFMNRDSEFIPSHGRITIGDNVWLGQNVTILKNVTIGDNVIIGYGSVVVRSIPSNSVAVGSPAKVICSFDDYQRRRREQFVAEAIDYAIAIYESGRTPRVSDFSDDYPAFVDGSNWHDYDFPYSRVFTKPGQFDKWKSTHKAPFHGFDEFMQAVEMERIARRKGDDAGQSR